jgi:hypothetical protein
MPLMNVLFRPAFLTSQLPPPAPPAGPTGPKTAPSRPSRPPEPAEPPTLPPEPEPRPRAFQRDPKRPYHCLPEWGFE